MSLSTRLYILYRPASMYRHMYRYLRPNVLMRVLCTLLCVSIYTFYLYGFTVLYIPKSIMSAYYSISSSSSF